MCIEELERKKLDAEELKGFVDARKFPVEVLFGTKETMPLQCKLVFASNKTLSVESDEGILRRGVQQNYTSRFLGADHADQGQPNLFVKGKNYSLKFENGDYKNAYLELLLRLLIKIGYSDFEADDGSTVECGEIWLRC